MSDTTVATWLDNAAHDLRNRVNVVLGGLQLVRADLPDDEAVADTFVAAQVLARWIERLVVGARIELDADGDPSEASLVTLLDVVAARVAREAKGVAGAGAAVAAAGRGALVGEHADLAVYADLRRVERVLADLAHLGYVLDEVATAHDDATPEGFVTLAWCRDGDGMLAGREIEGAAALFAALGEAGWAVCAGTPGVDDRLTLALAPAAAR